MVWSNAAEPRVCIVMPAYHAAETILAAANSVLSQNYANLVLGIGVPVHDTDTIAAIRKIDDPRLYLIEQTGSGISNGRNMVLQNVPADLYMFLDADDLMIPGAIAAYVRHRIETAEVGLRYGHYERVLPGDGSPVELRPAPFLGRVDHAFARLCVGSFATTGSVMIDREVVDRVGLFDTRFNHAEDWHYWLRVAKEFPVFGLDVVTYRYTYAKLGRKQPFPRSFFETSDRVAKELCHPVLLYLLARISIRAGYTAYYFRTLGNRHSVKEYLDIRPIDVLSVPPAMALMALRRWGVL